MPQRALVSKAPAVSPRSSALKATVTLLRLSHREAWHWHVDGDTAHREVLDRWAAAPEVAPYLDGARHTEKARRSLTLSARDFLADEDKRLRARWQEITRSRAYAEMPAAVRHVLWCLYAKGTAEGIRGGPNVLASYPVLIAMVDAQFGYEPGLGSIAYAAKWLEEHGVLTLTRGQKWEKGKPARGTVWHLLRGASLIPATSPGTLFNRPLEPEDRPIKQTPLGAVLEPDSGSCGAVLPPPAMTGHLAEAMEAAIRMQRYLRMAAMEEFRT